MSKYYSLVIFVPTTHSRAVREALVASGAGAQGNYDSCCFSVVGVGRFRPLQGATPALGKIGSNEIVAEERIETDVRHDRVAAVLKAVRAVHPYEQPSMHLTHLLDMDSFGKEHSNDDEIAVLRNRVDVVEETVRETLSGLVADMAMWQKAAKAQIEDVKSAQAQSRRSRDAVAATRTTPLQDAAGMNTSSRVNSSPSLDSRTMSGDGTDLRSRSGSTSSNLLHGLEKRLLSSEELLSEHERIFRCIIKERSALGEQAQSLQGLPTTSVVPSRPYSAPLNALDMRLKGIEETMSSVHQTLSEQTSVLEDHALTLQIMSVKKTPAATALPPSSPGVEGFV